MVERISTAFEKLTPREREILRLIAGHLQSKEIARALGLSPKTVEMHVLSARRRLSGMSRRDAALAFVAWEARDPGNDYRRQPDALVRSLGAAPSDREVGSEDDYGNTIDIAGASGSPRRDWRRDMSTLRWLGMILGITVATAVSLAVIATSLHQLMLAIQGIKNY